MSDSLGHLFGRAGLVEWRVRALIAERRAVDVAPDDAFRGLYLSDEVVDQLLDGVADAPVPVETELIAELDLAAGPDVRLLRLARSAQLTELDVELLLIAAMPDLDPRFERFYGYLNDDVTRRRATVGLALQLAGVSLLSAEEAVGEGQDAAAETALEKVAADSTVPDSYRQLAQLKLLILKGPSMDAAERDSQLAALAAPGAPFRTLAMEQQALALVADGKKDEALKMYQDLVQEAGVPGGLRQRAMQMIVVLGGEPASQ